MDPIQPKKRSTGKKKIEIKRIQKKENRQVCFSKRRKGLFKKANELCTLCGAEVAIVVLSLAGKPYYFDHPSADHALRRFLYDSDMFQEGTSCSEQMNSQELAYLREKFEAEMRRRKALEEALKAPKPFWMDGDVSLMGIEELMEYRNVLRQYQDMVAQAKQQNCSQAEQQSCFQEVEESFFQGVEECFFQAAEESCFRAVEESFFQGVEESFFQATEESCFQEAEQISCFQEEEEEAMWGIDGLLMPGGGEEENYFLCLEELLDK